MKNMNKVKLNTLGVLKRDEVETVQIGDAEIEVKRRIPYEEVLEMMQWCIDFIIGERPFISAPLKRIVKGFAILKWYTNLDIGFVEDNADLGDIYENFDLADQYGVIDTVYQLIEEKQRTFFDVTLDETLESIEKYRNSAKGIVDVLSEDAKENTENMEKAMSVMEDEKVKKILKIVSEVQ